MHSFNFKQNSLNIAIIQLKQVGIFKWFGNFIITEIVIHTSLQPPIGNFLRKI